MLKNVHSGKVPEARVHVRTPSGHLMFLFHVHQLYPAKDVGLQIKKPHVWLDPKLEKYLLPEEGGKRFIKLFRPITDYETFCEALGTWSAGTMYTLQTGKDFSAFFSNPSAPEKECAEVLAKLKLEHSIQADVMFDSKDLPFFL